MNAALTDKQLRFVFEYLQDQNATAAARRAGYAAKGACAQGNALLCHPLVAARIRDEMRSLLAEVKVSVMDLVRERVRAALFRADNLFATGWSLREREEVDAETRAAFQVGVTWRKGDPTLRLNQPNRERALAVLEKLHEKLDRQSAAHHADEESMPKRAARCKSEPEPAPTRQPGSEIMLDVHRGAVGLGPTPPSPAAGTLSVTWGGQTSVQGLLEPATEATSDSAASPIASEPAPLSTTTLSTTPPSTTPPPCSEIREKPIVSSGFPEPPAPPIESKVPAHPPSDLSPFAAVLAAHRKEKKGDSFRDDPNWMWGGKLKPIPPPEPSASLLEHLANVRHTELNAHVAEEMARRGGRIRPGPLRPAGLPPGYNPPWLRDNRPRFAEGAGEFYWTGDGPGE